MAIANTGLFEKVEVAREKTENAQELENTTLGKYEEEIDKYSNGGTFLAVEATTSETHIATEIPYSWEELSNIAKAISNTSSITNDTVEINVTLNGETKTLGVGDTKTVDGKTVRILGFNHDELTDSTMAYDSETVTGKAGISFEYVDQLAEISMNSSATNSGGWGQCTLRSTLNGDSYYGSLENKSYIKQVNKEYNPTYNNAPETMPTTSDYLWLLSCGEIWDNGYNGGVTRGYAIATEGSQYAYYKQSLRSTSYNTNTTVTLKNTTEPWWLRSPKYSDGSRFCYVYLDGSCNYAYAYRERSVAPGFCI